MNYTGTRISYGEQRVSLPKLNHSGGRMNRGNRHAVLGLARRPIGYFTVGMVGDT